MATMTLRGIADKTAEALKARAQKEGTSVNAVTLRLLRKSLGLDRKKRQVLYDDLDHLAGTWSHEEAAEFEHHTAVFERVDQDIWKKVSQLREAADLGALVWFSLPKAAHGLNHKTI